MEDWKVTISKYGKNTPTGKHKKKKQKKKNREKGNSNRRSNNCYDQAGSSYSTIVGDPYSFMGWISIPIPTKTINNNGGKGSVVFAQKITKSNDYRYFEDIQKDPIIQLRFEYSIWNGPKERQKYKWFAYGDITDGTNDDNEKQNVTGNDIMTKFLPVSVMVGWEYYPTEWPIEEREAYRDWLQTKCNERLCMALSNNGNENEASCTVCEFCENHAMEYWYETHYCFIERIQQSSPKDTERKKKEKVKQYKKKAQYGDKQKIVTKETAVTANNKGNNDNEGKNDDADRIILVVLSPNIMEKKIQTPNTIAVNNRNIIANDRNNENDHSNEKMTDEEKQEEYHRKQEKKKETKKEEHDDDDEEEYANFGMIVHPRTEARKQYRIKSKKGTVESAPMQCAKSTLVGNWQQLRRIDNCCPICFDPFIIFRGRGRDGQNKVIEKESVFVPGCDHLVCKECLEAYFASIIDDGLNSHRTNPFRCPADAKCQERLPIVDFVKNHISKERMDKIRDWDYELKYPPCHSFDRCLSRSCPASTFANDCMRQYPMMDKVVFCNVCNNRWCELCLKRGVKNDNHKCRQQVRVIMLCTRYQAATAEQKALCEAQYPWIKTYAPAAVGNDQSVLAYLDEVKGRMCPTCSACIERTGGCFHMQCSQCSTHFCYECGVELFPPFYGTHQCWVADT